jgi:CARDB protein
VVSSGGLVSASRGLLLLAGLLAGCEATSLEVHAPPATTDPEPSPKADLSPVSIQAPARIRLDSLLQMQVGVRNTGNRSAGPGWFVRVFLSTDDLIDPSDRQIDQFAATRDLPSGGQDSYLRNKKLSEIPPGVYHLGSIVDVTHLVPEATETNNALAAPASITLVPAEQ